MFFCGWSSGLIDLDVVVLVWDCLCWIFWMSSSLWLVLLFDWFSADRLCCFRLGIVDAGFSGMSCCGLSSCLIWMVLGDCSFQIWAGALFQCARMFICVVFPFSVFCTLARSS